MKHGLNPTTKRFSRTLSQAFPSGYEYAASVERHRSADTSGKTIAWVCGVVIALAVLGNLIGAAL
jgi:hypothetical protein